MKEVKTPRQLIHALAEGQAYLMFDPNDPAKMVAQVARQDGSYFVTGPLLNEIRSFDLKEVLLTGRSEDLDAMECAQLFNELMSEHEGKPEAFIHPCGTAAEAAHKLQILFKAYSV